MYIDKGGIDMSICRKKFGKKRRGRLLGKKSSKYYPSINIIVAYVNHKAIVIILFNGLLNAEVIEAWVGQFLIVELKPGQTVIMDNASFHKSRKN